MLKPMITVHSTRCIIASFWIGCGRKGEKVVCRWFESHGCDGVVLAVLFGVVDDGATGHVGSSRVIFHPSKIQSSTKTGESDRSVRHADKRTNKNGWNETERSLTMMDERRPQQRRHWLPLHRRKPDAATVPVGDYSMEKNDQVSN